MKRLLLLSVVISTLTIASCATTTTTSTTSSTPAQNYQCGPFIATFSYDDAKHNNASLTLSRIANGNVQADTLPMTRSNEERAREVFINNQMQTQWTNLAHGAELTYPIDGIVQFFPCQRK